VDGKGMHLGRRFRNVSGVLAGAPIHLSPSDLERTWALFDADVEKRRSGATTRPENERRKSDRRTRG
jgi:circadian clock protein KaiC